MNSKLKEKKPYYLIISRKIIFWLVVLMLGIAIFLLFTRQDANKGRLIFTMVQLLGMLLVLRIPQFIKDKYHFQIPNLLDFILISFAFSGFILGDVCPLSFRWPKAKEWPHQPHHGQCGGCSGRGLWLPAYPQASSSLPP